MQRHEFLNNLIRRFRFQSYLEIGCAADHTFKRIIGPDKTGVDPRRGGTHRMTSDEFFVNHATDRKWDLIFVDGLHHADQVLVDVQNALFHLAKRGLIVLDDCWPKREEQQLVEDKNGKPIMGPPSGKPWTGDVWKAVVKLRQMDTLDVCVLAEGWGFGVVIPRANTSSLVNPPETLDWAIYQKRTKALLRLVDRRGLEDFLRPLSEAKELEAKEL